MDLIDLRGRCVRFRLRDVHLPDPRALLYALHGDDMLCGKVIAISDTGQPGGTYAVVETSEVDRPVIVSTGLLRPSKS